MYGSLIGLFVHIGLHKDRVCLIVLYDNGQQAVGILLEILPLIGSRNFRHLNTIVLAQILQSLNLLNIVVYQLPGDSSHIVQLQNLYDLFQGNLRQRSDDRHRAVLCHLF